MNNQSAISWQHHHPVHVSSAPGLLSRLPEFVHGKNILLLTSRGFTKRGITDKICSQLSAFNLLVIDQVTPNPELDDIEEMASRVAKITSIHQIVALGGGSVMDTAKVLATIIPTLASVGKPLHSHFREHKKISLHSRLPLITIPTTSGTGAEVTPFATIWDRTTHSKYSLSGNFMYPDLALLDSELTLSLPISETLSGGLDALSHSLESLWNKHRTPISSAYARAAIEKICRALPLLLHRPEEQLAREEMQQASLLAGLAISQTRTAIAHSISYPLTSHYGVPHGIACSFTLPALIERIHRGHLLPDEELDLLLEAQRILRQLPLFSSLAKYISWSQIEALQSEMFNPQRADNFIQNLTAEDISAIITRSQQLALHNQ
ncbi:phosphonoacetaldehyde reductase [uncultured Tolumonas sp.]|uniref:phosphonoacetaldehyde reductase n=1 Tax=uncultured Tolumonas sp. TaxID=263765 RepID=UPI002A0A5437|nr:phosphonoacetaldehyde reductase [uncultured Tolumonas sp.]